MKLDLLSISFVTSIVFITQSIAVYIQYKLNKSSKAVGWWFAGSVLMSLGFLLILTVNIKSVWFLAAFANPIIVLGSVFLYVGVLKFFSLPENKWLLRFLYFIFLISYFSFILLKNDISGRTIIISLFLVIISWMTAYKLLFIKSTMSSSSKFTAVVFLIYGCFHAVRTVYTLVSPNIKELSELNHITIQIVIFLTPIIASILWTFGFVLMVNQKLNVDILKEKENLRTIFNASVEAKLITRMRDGLIIDANEEFTQMTGYSYQESVGKSAVDIDLWNSPEERLQFISELNEGDNVAVRELEFRRKDGSLFFGLILGKVIIIDDAPHIVCVISDITERKRAESQISELIAQLESEKKTAQINAITDSLTGLLNRRYFDEYLRHEFSRLERSCTPISLIMLDVDHFKLYNDTYGHISGDNCLRMIAETLKSVVSSELNILVRYGGEEFTVILTETENDGAIIFARRILNAVEQLKIPHSTSETSKFITVSLGVVTAFPANISDPEKLVNMADEALYKAKEDGRNRFVVYPEDLKVE